MITDLADDDITIMVHTIMDHLTILHIKMTNLHL